MVKHLLTLTSCGVDISYLMLDRMASIQSRKSCTYQYSNILHFLVCIVLKDTDSHHPCLHVERLSGAIYFNQSCIQASVCLCADISPHSSRKGSIMFYECHLDIETQESAEDLCYFMPFFLLCSIFKYQGNSWIFAYAVLSSNRVVVQIVDKHATESQRTLKTHWIPKTEHWTKRQCNGIFTTPLGGALGKSVLAEIPKRLSWTKFVTNILVVRNNHLGKYRQHSYPLTFTRILATPKTRIFGVVVLCLIHIYRRELTVTGVGDNAQSKHSTLIEI